MSVSQSQSQIMAPRLRTRARRPAGYAAGCWPRRAGLLVVVAVVQTVLTGVGAPRWAPSRSRP